MSSEALQNREPGPARYLAGDLVLDVGQRKVLRAGVVLDVAGLSFDLLLALARAAPNLLSHDDLLLQVWGRQIVPPSSVRSSSDAASQPRDASKKSIAPEPATTGNCALCHADPESAVHSARLPMPSDTPSRSPENSRTVVNR